MKPVEYDPSAPVYRAGERVPAGYYVEIESGREVHLLREDELPPTFDGRVGIYRRRRPIWAEVRRRGAGV
jgi:hypothetical protein